MADDARLTELIEPEVKAEGFALVRVKMLGGRSDPTLQIMAERPDTRQLTLDDCSRLSRRCPRCWIAWRRRAATRSPAHIGWR
jgi:ribosome maturation factor RimP